MLMQLENAEWCIYFFGQLFSDRHDLQNLRQRHRTVVSPWIKFDATQFIRVLLFEINFFLDVITWMAIARGLIAMYTDAHLLSAYIPFLKCIYIKKKLLAIQLAWEQKQPTVFAFQLYI